MRLYEAYLVETDPVRFQKQTEILNSLMHQFTLIAADFMSKVVRKIQSTSTFKRMSATSFY